MKIDAIEDFLPYFEKVRARTRNVVDRIPADLLEWRAGEDRFTAGDLVRHLAGTERWMWAENVRGRPSRYPGCGRELADGLTAVVAYMDDLHAEAVAIFEALTPDDLAAPCATLGGIELPTWKWLRAMIEHEVHHRGQLYFILGLAGAETSPLYGLTERDVFARSVHDDGRAGR
jgi:uncharacterized damage-inducible protein DinB